MARLTEKAELCKHAKRKLFRSEVPSRKKLHRIFGAASVLEEFLTAAFLVLSARPVLKGPRIEHTRQCIADRLLIICEINRVH